MKVNSPLANMDIYIGRVSKSSGGLLVESREDSTMSAEILVGPRDARDFLLSLLKKPLVLLYLLALPLIGENSIYFLICLLQFDRVLLPYALASELQQLEQRTVLEDEEAEVDLE